MFEDFVEKRDTAPHSQREYFQRRVVEYFDKIFGEGYYQDSYDDSNLLWKLGLDYGGWFARLLDGERLLQPQKAALVLSEVKGRRNRLAEIEDLEERKSFEEKFDQFTHFLEIAIGGGEPIACSL